MTQADLKKTIVITAEYYGRQLQPITIQAMADDLKGIDPQIAILAYHRWRKNPKNRSMPMPSQILAMIKGEPPSQEAMGRELASRIVGAISDFGWPNAGKAREYIGEDGWRLIERFGGWQYLCENLGVNLSVQTFYAQARDLAASHAEFADKGICPLGSLPKFSDRRSSLEPFGDIMKHLPGSDEGGNPT